MRIECDANISAQLQVIITMNTVSLFTSFLAKNSMAKPISGVVARGIAPKV